MALLDFLGLGPWAPSRAHDHHLTQPRAAHSREGPPTDARRSPPRLNTYSATRHKGATKPRPTVSQFIPVGDSVSLSLASCAESQRRKKAQAEAPSSRCSMLMSSGAMASWTQQPWWTSSSSRQEQGKAVHGAWHSTSSHIIIIITVIGGGRGENLRETERSEMEGVGGRSREYEEGCRLKIKTTLGDDIEGHVLTYDRSTNIVVIHILLQSLSRLGFCAIFGVSG